MPDMLVKLYNLPDIKPIIDRQKENGVQIVRAIPPEKHLVVSWVKERFGEGWASECEVAFSNHPPSCFIAVKNNELIGFACYDATCKDFFGPIGVSENYRRRGIGKALLLICLHTMFAMGYGYAIIGDTGNILFYKKAVGATVIRNSKPGIYRGIKNA